MTCPCGVGADAESCCAPIIRGEKDPETAEALMRARYSAYVLDEVHYILDSNHPDTKDEVDLTAAGQWAKSADWQGLEIVETVDGGVDDTEGEVEFVARYHIGNERHRHHERARFKRDEGRWTYLDGDMVKPKPVVREGPRIGRNDPCPCGSGKKYKKCCGAAA